MLTLETLLREYSLVGSGSSESYHNVEVFDGFGELCDVYFGSENGNVKDEQIMVYNLFKDSYKKYANEIDLFMQSSFDRSEQKRSAKINDTVLRFDVIDVPFENQNMTCSYCLVRAIMAFLD